MLFRSYHKDVDAYEVFDKDGKFLAVFYTCLLYTSHDYECLGLNVIGVDASEKFFKDLEGVTEPEPVSYTHL